MPPADNAVRSVGEQTALTLPAITQSAASHPPHGIRSSRSTAQDYDYNQSLGISLPCQMMQANLLMPIPRRTAVDRR